MRTLVLFSASLAGLDFAGCEANPVIAGEQAAVRAGTRALPGPPRRTLRTPPHTEGLGRPGPSPVARPRTTRAQLAEARRQAGFKSADEERAEAMAAYEKAEREFIKGRLRAYRALVQRIRSALASVKRRASQWARSPDPEAAFTRWNAGYARRNAAWMKDYRALTEEGTRGGEMQSQLEALVTAWENFNGDLEGAASENQAFAQTFSILRAQLDAFDAQLDAIEHDEALEAAPVPLSPRSSKASARK